MSRRFALRPIAAAALALSGGCDTITSDFGSFFDSFNPPTPAQAAQWAADANDAENQRRGIALLASAPWGGAEPYVRLYRLYVEEPTDPLVKAFSIRALGRHGDASDAVLVAKQLESPNRLVRLEAAKALQRLHDPQVADSIWKRLIDEAEEDQIRTELAIALGQYPSDPVLQALIRSLDQRELAVNWAALDSLHSLTGRDLGLDQQAWLAWREAGGQFPPGDRFLYPTFTRPRRVMDYLLFWVPLEFEDPGVPVGTPGSGPRRTYEGDSLPPVPEDFRLPELAPSAPAETAPVADRP